FKEFATSYKAYTEGMEKEETDWDKMSKDFNFQYGGFARTLKDGILIKELADALKYSQSEDGKQNRTLMYENQKALDTSWEGNEKLHPSGKSSAQLYRELHMQKDYSQPQAADLLKTQSTEAVDKLIIERQNGDLKGRVENYASGSLVGGVLAFLGATLLKKNGEDALKSEVAALKKQLAEAGSKAAEQASDALNDRIKELESQLEKQATNFDLQQQALQRLDGKLSTATNKLASKNKAMVAVGIGAAVVGGVGTYFAAKYISKKKAEKANENQAPAEQTKPAEEVKAPETSAPAQATTPEVKDVPRTTNILQRHISMNDFAKQA
ncbi:hypothetical protein II906_01955, partial [bacterium]|nr:hypothetical protein [bacterium]